MTNWQILTGDVREKLSEIPDGSVQCVVTLCGSTPLVQLQRAKLRKEDIGFRGELSRHRQEAIRSSVLATRAHLSTESIESQAYFDLFDHGGEVSQLPLCVCGAHTQW